MRHRTGNQPVILTDAFGQLVFVQIGFHIYRISVLSQQFDALFRHVVAD